MLTRSPRPPPWRGSLAEQPSLARQFYTVIAVAMLLGLGLDFAGFNGVAMLFWAAVLNGLLAPPLIVVIVLLTSSRRVMGERANPAWLKVLGWVTVAVMTGSAMAMFVALR